MTAGSVYTMIRSFVAVPLPAPIQAALFAVTEELGRPLPDVKWSRKVENLHVTIKFLGSVAEERLPEVAAALDRAMGALPRFSIDVCGVGAFPSAGRANVIWVGANDGSGRLAAVARAVEDVAAALGVGERENRPFTGLVTLGRVKSRGRGADARRALAGFADRAFGTVEVTELHLYESQLGGDGSTYILRSRAALKSN
jgi:2'-5' RNA ligase